MLKPNALLNWASRHEDLLGSGGVAPRILNFGTRWRWVVSFTYRPLYSRLKSPGIHWVEGWVGPRPGLDAVAKTRSPFHSSTGTRTRSLVTVVTYRHFTLTRYALAGLLLVPNGEIIGRALGDYYPSQEHVENLTISSGNWSDNSSNSTMRSDADYPHPWSVFFTVLGTVLLDFDADACQSPSRAYLLDVTCPGKKISYQTLTAVFMLYPPPPHFYILY
jgi:hypothetical protein